MRLNNTIIIVFVTFFFINTYFPSINSAYGQGAPKNLSTPDSRWVATLSLPKGQETLLLGEPLFVNININNVIKTETSSTILEIGSADNFSPWELSREDKNYTAYSTRNATRQSYYSHVVDPGEGVELPEVVWFGSGKNRDLLLNSPGIWYIRVAIYIKTGTPAKFFRVTSNSIKVTIKTPPEYMGSFVDDLKSFIGDSQNIPRSKRDTIISKNSTTSDEISRKYSSWLLIRNYISDASWRDELERESPKALDKLNELFLLSNNVSLHGYKNTIFAYDLYCLQAYKYLFDGKYDLCAKLIRSIPEGYDNSWIRWLREWLHDEYQPIENGK